MSSRATNVLSAYRDNAAVIRGGRGGRFFPEAGDADVQVPRRRYSYSAEGGDAQSSDSNFAVARRGDGIGRRDSRRRCDRARRQAEGWTVRLHGIESELAAGAATVGAGVWQAVAYCFAARHHDRRAAGRGCVQRRVWPAGTVLDTSARTNRRVAARSSDITSRSCWRAAWEIFAQSM